MVILEWTERLGSEGGKTSIVVLEGFLNVETKQQKVGRREINAFLGIRMK